LTHKVHSDWRGPSDHAPVTISIPIPEVGLVKSRRTLPKDSEFETGFLEEVSAHILSIDTNGLTSIKALDDMSDAFAQTLNDAWETNAKHSEISTRSKSWWNTACANAIKQYRRTRLAGDRKEFKRQVRLAKRKFFDERINHIANTTQRPWDLMDWTKQRQLPTHEAIKFQGEPCNSLDSLWDALHGTYNSASDRPTDNTILEETPREPLREWVPFSKAELRDELKKCSNTSAPGPDHITWYHLKKLCSNDQIAEQFTSIANACLTVGHWPSHFKESNLVILPKPGKPSYDTPKSFRLIVLLNM